MSLIVVFGTIKLALQGVVPAVLSTCAVVVVKTGSQFVTVEICCGPVTVCENPP